MAPIPKERGARARDDRRRKGARAETITGSDSSPVGPTLRKVTGVDEWSRPVVRWFDTWRRSPQARLFVGDVEWETLGRAAYLLEQFYDPDTSPGVRVQTWNAIRALESTLGATHADRVRSHVKIKPAEPEVEQVASVVDYRARLAT